MIDMALADLLYSKIANNDDEEYGAPFVVPKARGVGGLAVTCCVEASFRELVGKHARLGLAIDVFADL